MKTIELHLPDELLVQTGQTLKELEQRSQFLLALKYFELNLLSSGHAAAMSGMGRMAFLLEASRLGVPIGDLAAEELGDEFRDV